MFKWYDQRKWKSENPIPSDELRDGKPELVTPLFDIKPRANIHAKIEYLDRLIRMKEGKCSLLASQGKHVDERLNEVCDSIEKDLGIDDHSPDFDSDIHVTVGMDKATDDADKIARKICERMAEGFGKFL